MNPPVQLPRHLVEQMARGRPFQQEGDPALIAAHATGLPAALARRPRLIALSALALAVPVPLVLVPVGLAVGGILQPFGFALAEGPMLLCGLLAAGVWATRQAWPEPWTVRNIVDILPRLNWQPGSVVKVEAQQSSGFYEAQTLWEVQGVLAGGHRVRVGVYDRSQKKAISTRREGRRRITKYMVWDRVAEELELWPASPLVATMRTTGAVVLAADGVTPEQARVSAESIGWERRGQAFSERRGAPIASAIGAILYGLGERTPIVRAAAPVEPASYQPPRWTFYVWASLVLMFFAALAAVAATGLGYLFLPRIGPLAAVPPFHLDATAMAFTSVGVLLSLALCVVSAALFIRESRL